MNALRTIPLAIALIVVAASSSLAAGNNDPSKFFGTFAGEAKTVFDSKNKRVGEKRTTRVEIRKAAEGRFVVSWTTDFPDRKRIAKRLRTTTMEFTPTGNPAVWRALRTGNPLFGQALIWARVADTSITIYIVGVLKSGVMLTAMYRRVLDGDTMKLEFERTEDGTRRRAVQGSLTRVKG